VTILTLALLLVAGTSWGGPITLGLVPGSQSIGIGGFADVEIFITGLDSGAAPSLSAFDIDILFDFSVLNLTGVFFGDSGIGDQLNLLGAGSITANNNIGPGHVNLWEVSLNTPADLDSLQAGDFTLLTLQFQGVGLGVGNVVLSLNYLGDSIGNPLTASLDPRAASITVGEGEPIPEPSTLGFLLIGLTVFGIGRRFLAK
jgi:hypothetical protein